MCVCVGHHYAVCSAAFARPVYQQTLPVLPPSIWEWILNRTAVSHIWTGLPNYWVFIYCMGNFSFPTWLPFNMLLSAYSQINLVDSTIKFSPCKTRKHVCLELSHTTIPLVPRCVIILCHCPLLWKPELIYLATRLLWWLLVYSIGFVNQCNGYVIVVTFLSADFWR